MIKKLTPLKNERTYINSMKQEFPLCNWTGAIWRTNNIQLIVNNKYRLICQLCIIDGKFDSGRILYKDIAGFTRYIIFVL